MNAELDESITSAKGLRRRKTNEDKNEEEDKEDKDELLPTSTIGSKKAQLMYTKDKGKTCHTILEIL